MTFDNFYDPKKTSRLIGYEEEFNFLIRLIKLKKFPKVLMITGEKGIGKSTLVNHLMHYYFDNNFYDLNRNTFKKNIFHNQLCNNIFQNIIYLNGSNFSKIKIDDIRNLKNKLSQSNGSKNMRFIILDDAEIFNTNSHNALLKLIEEPGNNNHFILINNKIRPLLATIKSRCIEMKFTLNNKKKNDIISFLSDYFDEEIILEKNVLNISPGNFILFNHFFLTNNIKFEDGLLLNIEKILNFYKKEKNIFYKHVLLFYIEYNLKKDNFFNYNNKNLFFQNRNFIIKKINEFFLYNLSQNTLLNSLENKLINE